VRQGVAHSGARRRVVVMIDSLEAPGGGERLAVENAVLLDRSKFDRYLCVTRWKDGMEAAEPARSMLARMSEAGVGVVKLRRRSKLAPWDWWPLWRLLRRERVDVLHAHMFGSNVWAVIVGRLARVPAVVAHEHIWSYEGNPVRRLLDRHLIARFSDAFVAVSGDGRRLMVDREGIDPADVVVIPNGIADRPHGDGARFRVELGLEGALLVGSVGNLRQQKAYEILIEAAARLRERVPTAHVLIAGEGPDRPRLEALVARLGVGDTVRLLGARSDVPDLLAALDVAVCCSDFEGSPLAVMEYMQAGLPVVGTRIGGLAELLDDGENGLVIEPRDPAALAAALVELLEGAERRARLGARGAELREQRWRLATWIGRIEDLYEELLAKRRR
jgi:glycosyltransferase involved in cell wall biosynthesis